LTIRRPSPVVPEGYTGGRVRARELSWGLKNGNRVVFFGFEAGRSQEGNKEIFIDGFLEQKRISVDFKRWVFWRDYKWIWMVPSHCTSVA
jgi:hypothetical protein